MASVDSAAVRGCDRRRDRPAPRGPSSIATGVMAAALVVAPHVGIYPVFLMKALCFALFACAFNLLLGFGGLLSFGHAMFLGTAGLRVRARGEGVGRAARARDPRRHGGVGAAGRSSPARSRSGGRASISR